MVRKTISGHYGTTHSLSHNNRDFTPKNVDSSRSINNDYLVAAGHLVQDDFPYISDMQTLWSSYRIVTEMYWREYRLKSKELSERLKELRAYQRKLEWLSRQADEEPFLFLIELLLLPLLMPIDIALSVHLESQIEELDAARMYLRFENEIFLHRKSSLRNALRQRDRRLGTSILAEMDTLVSVGSKIADIYFPPAPRFATVEEIYAKVFEPGFQEFQNKQRKCRRYSGTYLEQIRSRQSQKSNINNKSEKNRTVSEAIEIVFTIGDMDNTGYDKAPIDAAKAEQLLRDFNQHLLSLPNVCVVTTTELNTPNWKPSFRHGLILLNLTGHFDEATPGIHMTAIPYSRGCKRGPDAQPSLGRAFTGMGYPSTWRNVVDENGDPVPKRDKNNNIIYNEDNTPRIRKEPERQGILDWIAEQKMWLSKEMDMRYGWKREYKGTHPRGNLSTPDYKAARALERLAEAELVFRQSFSSHTEKILQLNQTLSQTIQDALSKHPDFQIILDYLDTCPKERIDQLIEEAKQSFLHLPTNELNQLKDSLSQLIASAEKKAKQEKQYPKDKMSNLEDKYGINL